MYLFLYVYMYIYIYNIPRFAVAADSIHLLIFSRLVMLLYAESERLSLALAGLESIVAECNGA